MNRNDFIDFYAELGLVQTATQSEIRQAYMERIKEVHPDKLQNATERERKIAEQKSQRLNQAKEILLDDDKRFDYDNLYKSKLSEASATASEYGFDGRRYNEYAQDVERFRAERNANLKSQSRYRPFVFIIIVVMAGLSILWRLVKPETLADFSKPIEQITLEEPIQIFKVGSQAYEVAIGESSVWVATESNQVQEWQFDNSKKPINTISLSDPAMTIAIQMPNLAIGDKGGMVNLINLIDPKKSKAFKAHSAAISSIDFSSSQTELLTSSWDKTVRVWKVDTGEQLRTRLGIAFPIYSASFDDKGQQIGFTNDAQAMIWNWREGTMKTLTLHKRRIFATASFGDWIATSGDDRVIKQIHFKTNSVRSIDTDVSAVKISYRFDGKYIVAAGQDGRVRIYNAETCKKVEVINAHQGKVNAAKFSPDGKELFTAGTDSTLKVWDMRKLL